MTLEERQHLRQQMVVSKKTINRILDEYDKLEVISFQFVDRIAALKEQLREHEERIETVRNGLKRLHERLSE